MRQYIKLRAQLDGTPIPSEADSTVQFETASTAVDMNSQLLAQTAGSLDFGFDPLFH